MLVGIPSLSSMLIPVVSGNVWAFLRPMITMRFRPILQRLYPKRQGYIMNSMLNSLCWQSIIAWQTTRFAKNVQFSIYVITGDLLDEKKQKDISSYDCFHHGGLVKGRS